MNRRQMDNRSNHFLFPSIIVNIVVLATLAYMLFRCGTVTHLIDRFSNLGAPKASLDSAQISYLTRETLFEQLPAYRHPIVFLGDSQTANCEWGELFAGAINRGIGGDTSAGLLKRISTITHLEPRAIFLMIGGNDFFQKVSPQETASNIRMAIREIRESSPQAVIYVQSLTPTWREERNRFAQQVNKMLESMADGKSVFYLDLYHFFLEGDFLSSKYSYDGTHLNGLGFMVWKHALDPYIALFLPADGVISNGNQTGHKLLSFTDISKRSKIPESSRSQPLLSGRIQVPLRGFQFTLQTGKGSKHWFRPDSD